MSGRTLLDYQGNEIPDKDTSLYSFEFTLSSNESRIIFNFKSELETGEINIWLGGGGYEVIGNYTNDGEFAYRDIVFGPLNNSEPVIVKVHTKKASGKWSIKLTESSPTGIFLSLLASGIIILTVCVVLLIKWKVKSGDSFKWPILGAAAWAVSIIAKFLFAYWLNEPVLGFIKSSFGQTGYLSLGSIYIGALTGIFEIGIALIFVLTIKKTYENAYRGIGFGLGAGAIEAMLIGFYQVGALILVISGSRGSGDIITGYTNIAVNTPLVFLVAPVERTIAILCHISSRALVVLAVAKRKQIYFWAGFLILTAIDIIAGYVHLAGYVNTISTWWIELALLPFAIVSFFIIRWYYKNFSKTTINLQQ